jgi:Flp pilus assembly protein TadD
MVDLRDSELERAERLIRRGELTEAATALEALVERHPDDQHLVARLASVRRLADPAAMPPPPSHPGMSAVKPTQTLSAEEQAEAFIAAGHLDGAADLYADVLRKRPDHHLARERLGELRRAASHAERLPEDPVQMLEELLRRVNANRKP